MTRKWNRKPKRAIEQTVDEYAIKTEVPAKFKVKRIHPKSRKRKPPGFTVLLPSQLSIFENNK
jgi:hypothetical protein